MPSNPNSLWYVLRETLANWSKHDASTHGAALAFSTLFAIAPILILVVSVSGWAFGVQAAQGQVQRDLSLFIGSQSAGVVQDLVAATGALMQLQDTLNTVWEVTPKPGFFLRRLLLKRLLCFGLILGVGLLLLASLAASAGLIALQKLLEARLEVGLSKFLGWSEVTF